MAIFELYEQLINEIKALSTKEYNAQQYDLIKQHRNIQDALNAKCHEMLKDPWYIQNSQDQLAKNLRKKKAKNDLGMRINEWAEANVKRGDLIKFQGTRSTSSWREVLAIAKAWMPEYGSARITGYAIQFNGASYDDFSYLGSSSVNGADKIDLVVRNNEILFNRALFKKE